jgi:hypothetical protein
MHPYLNDANQQKTSNLAIEYQSPDGISRFVRDILEGDPTPYQSDILYNFVDKRRAAVRGPHGLGKTCLAAWVVLWAVSVFDTDVKVVTTASAHRQLTYYLWPEIRKWSQKADWSKLNTQIRYGRELREYSIKLPDKEAFPVASDNPALIEGAHASTLIYVFDEAKAIPAGVWDAAEGAFSTGNCYALAISTPGEPSGRFYDIHKRKSGLTDWWVRHVTLDEAITAGRINPEWAKERLQQWGEGSAVYQNRVKGEFAETGTDSVIPLAWVEKAVERWHECSGVGEGKTSYGVDVAYQGEDQTVIGRLVGNVLEWLRYSSQEDPMQTTGRVIAAVGTDKVVPIAVDTIGIGAGTYARLAELKYNAVPCNVAEGTSMTDSSGELSFINLRAALWWSLREALDPNGTEPLAIPPDDLLIGDLTAPKWTYTSAGKIKVESKDDIRKRLGRSTDAADGLALAWYPAHSFTYAPQSWD